MLTPYAVLLLKPNTTDDEIRKRFHQLAKSQHPDRSGAQGIPGPLWHGLTSAYNQVKTQTARSTWERHAALKAGRCVICKGQGVLGGRLSGGIKICDKCRGEGTVTIPAADAVKPFKKSRP